MNSAPSHTCVVRSTSIVPAASASGATRARSLLAAVGFALATALAAQVYIPLPNTPVPMTLQTLVVMLAGVTLGAKLGTFSMAFYVLLGTTGYHVFAAGNWGLATVAGPTGGFLIGFVLAQPVLARLSRARGWHNLLLALLAGQAVIFACGIGWLAAWTGGGLALAVALGLTPFVPGIVVKTAAAMALAPIARRLGGGSVRSAD